MAKRCGWAGTGSPNRALRPAQRHDRKTAVPIPKFARARGTISCELRNQRDTSNSMILVPLFESEVRNCPCSTMRANFGFGALGYLRNAAIGAFGEGVGEAPPRRYRSAKHDSRRLSRARLPPQ